MATFSIHVSYSYSQLSIVVSVVNREANMSVNGIEARVIIWNEILKVVCRGMWQLGKHNFMNYIKVNPPR